MEFIQAFIEGVKMGISLLLTILNANPLFTIILALFVGGSLLLAFIVRIINEIKLRKSGILEVDQMTGRRFEEYLKALLKRKGYSVQLTSASGDYGADLILSTKGKKIAVQAKRYKKNVGIKAVQEIASAKNHYKADECWVITNSFFTNPAKELARSNQVKLIDRKQLIQWMIEKNIKNIG